MKHSLDYVLDHIDRLTLARREFVERANKWDRMWKLDAWTETREEARSLGREQVTSPDPFNVVHLTERLIDTNVDIDVAPVDSTVEADKVADAIERWLMAAWKRISNDTNTNVIGDAWWMAALRGRSVFQLMWVEEKLPEFQRKFRLPFQVRVLDPRDCGFHDNGVYIDFCFHRSTITLAQARIQFPGVTFKTRDNRQARQDEDEIEVVVNDCWWIDQDTGKVWNAVTVDDQFGIDPFETKYPDLPMFEFAFDKQPHGEEGHRTYSILRGLEETWPLMNSVLSQVATGMWWYFWPAIFIQNEMGEDINNIKVGPGTTNPLPMGTQVTRFDMAPNVPLAADLIERLDAKAQESTFTKILYGDAGNLQAGFAVANLRNAAESRIGKGIEQLEWAIERVSGLILAMVEAYQPDGVRVLGDDNRMGGGYWEVIDADMIDGNYMVTATVRHRVPTDEVQKATLGRGLYQDRIISGETMRNNFIEMKLPINEAERVELEDLFRQPMMKEILGQSVLAAHYGPHYMDVIQHGLEMRAQLQQMMQQAAMQAQGPSPLQQGDDQGAPGQPMMPPEMPPPGVPGGPGSLNPQAMMQGQIPPQMEGQVTEDMMGLGAGVPPEIYQQLINGNMGRRPDRS